MGEVDFWSDIPEDKKALLTDPALLYRVKCELDRLVKGEDKNKLLLWLVGASSYVKTMGDSAWNLSAIVTGESSGGKSWLVKKVLQFFRNVERFTRLTSASPDRLNQDFSNKILWIEELRGAEAAQATLRVWLSEGNLRLLTTERDEKGRITTRILETKGFPTFITTTTSVEIDNELLNRILILSIDESVEQTRDVLRFEAEMFRELGVSNGLEPNPLFIDLPLHLQKVTHVLIPYADILAEKFPIPEGREQSVSPRRDFPKLLFLIGVIAWLHQMQRMIVQRGPYFFVVADVADFYMAWRLCDVAIQNTLLKLSERHRAVLNCFKSPDETLTVKEVAAATGYSENRARELLNSLVKKGFLSREENPERRRTFIYQLRRKPAIDATIHDFVTSLLSFQEKKLEKILSNGNYTTRYTPKERAEIVDPLTGERYQLTTPDSCLRVVSKMLKIEKISLEQQKTLLDATKQQIVTSPKPSHTLKVLEHPSLFPTEKCSLCGKQPIYAQINYTDGSWGLLCEECYMKKLKELEETE